VAVMGSVSACSRAFPAAFAAVPLFYGFLLSPSVTLSELSIVCSNTDRISTSGKLVCSFTAGRMTIFFAWPGVYFAAK